MFNPNQPAEDRSRHHSRFGQTSAAGLVRHRLSNVIPQQIEEGRRSAPIVCVKETITIWHIRDDRRPDRRLDQAGIAYVPFFTLGGFTPLQSSTLFDVSGRLGANAQ